jgi:hypothetical protein
MIENDDCKSCTLGGEFCTRGEFCAVVVYIKYFILYILFYLNENNIYIYINFFGILEEWK